MTESRLEPSGARNLSLILVVGLALGGCRPGLPPEPPGQDAADPKAATPGYEPTANVYETSAFEGAKMRASSGHEHHHGMGKKQDAAQHATEDEPAMKMPMDHKMPKETQGEPSKEKPAMKMPVDHEMPEETP